MATGGSSTMSLPFPHNSKWLLDIQRSYIEGRFDVTLEYGDDPSKEVVYLLGSTKAISMATAYILRTVVKPDVTSSLCYPSACDRMLYSDETLLRMDEALEGLARPILIPSKDPWQVEVRGEGLAVALVTSVLEDIVHTFVNSETSASALQTNGPMAEAGCALSLLSRGPISVASSTPTVGSSVSVALPARAVTVTSVFASGVSPLSATFCKPSAFVSVSPVPELPTSSCSSPANDFVVSRDLTAASNEPSSSSAAVLRASAFEAFVPRHGFTQERHAISPSSFENEFLPVAYFASHSLATNCSSLDVSKKDLSSDESSEDVAHDGIATKDLGRAASQNLFQSAGLESADLQQPAVAAVDISSLRTADAPVELLPVATSPFSTYFSPSIPLLSSLSSTTSALLPMSSALVSPTDVLLSTEDSERAYLALVMNAKREGYSELEIGEVMSELGDGLPANVLLDALENRRRHVAAGKQVKREKISQTPTLSKRRQISPVDIATPLMPAVDHPSQVLCSPTRNFVWLPDVPARGRVPVHSFDLDLSDSVARLHSAHPPGQPSLGARLRYVVVDGSNVAMSHGSRGRSKQFSCRGLRVCVDYFKRRGHREITIIVPQFRRHDPHTVDGHILDELLADRVLIYQPTKKLPYGPAVAPYDDRMILDLAVLKDGVVISNDNYKDLLKENNPLWNPIILNRVIMFSYLDDETFYINSDPMGRGGPKLEELLSHRTGSERPVERSAVAITAHDRMTEHLSSSFPSPATRLPPPATRIAIKGLDSTLASWLRQKMAPVADATTAAPVVVETNAVPVDEATADAQALSYLTDFFPNEERVIKTVLSERPGNRDINYLATVVLERLRVASVHQHADL